MTIRLLNFLRETFADALSILRSPEGWVFLQEAGIPVKEKINSESNLSPSTRDIRSFIRDIIASGSEIGKFEGFHVEVIDNGRKSRLHRTDCD